MSKTSKHRECPAVKRTITSQECGENRNLAYACTADCGFNPFAPANYSALLELEEKLDHATAEGLRLNRETRDRIEREFERIGFDRMEPALSLLSMETFFRKGPDGRTWAERWQAEGCGNWKSDLRALFARKARLRARLLEVLEVRNEAECLVKDLLEPERPPFVLRDLTIAARVCRFDTFLALTYDLPFFSRFMVTVVPIMDLGWSSVEALAEIARHLGAPAEKEALNVWLVEHLAEVADSVGATLDARQAAALQASDLRFGKVVYSLRAPLAQCREALDAVPEVGRDPLGRPERNEGFVESRVWLDAAYPQSPGFQRLHGRVLLGQSHWRLETMGEKRTNRLRELFEKTMGERVQFEGMRLDDIRQRPAPATPGPLVPPRLMENVSKIEFGSTRVNLALLKRPGETEEEAILRVNDEDFLRLQVPELGGETPRKAAADPALRPKLIENLKRRINSADRKNLEQGTSYSPQWMLEELGVTELMGPPPPKRPRPERPTEDYDTEGTWSEEEEGSLSDDLAEPPPIPEGRHLAPALTEEISALEMNLRATEAKNQLGSEEAMIDEAVAAGCCWFECAPRILELEAGSPRWAALSRALVPVWFAMVPVGGFVPNNESEDVEYFFQEDWEEIAGKGDEKFQEILSERLALSGQGQIAKEAIQMLRSHCEAEKIDDSEGFRQAVIFLAAAVDELAAALEMQNEDLM